MIENTLPNKSRNPESLKNQSQQLKSSPTNELLVYLLVFFLFSPFIDFFLPFFVGGQEKCFTHACVHKLNTAKVPNSRPCIEGLNSNVLTVSENLQVVLFTVWRFKWSMKTHFLAKSLLPIWEGCSKLRALRALVPYVPSRLTCPRVLRALVSYVPSRLTCPRALRALALACFKCLTCLACPRALSALKFI